MTLISPTTAHEVRTAPTENFFFTPSTSYKLHRSALGLEAGHWEKDPPSDIGPSSNAHKSYSWTAKGNLDTPHELPDIRGSVTYSILDPKNGDKHTGDAVTISWDCPDYVLFAGAKNDHIFTIEVKNSVTGKVKATKSFRDYLNVFVENVYFELSDDPGKALGFKVDAHR